MFPTLFKDVPLVLCKLNFFCFLLFFTTYLITSFTFNSRLIIIVIVLKLHIKFFSYLQVFLKAWNIFLLIHLLLLHRIFHLNLLLLLLLAHSCTWHVAERSIISLLFLVILLGGPWNLHFLAIGNKWAAKPDLNGTGTFATTRPLFMEREHVGTLLVNVVWNTAILILGFLWLSGDSLIDSLCCTLRIRGLRLFYFFLFFLFVLI